MNAIVITGPLAAQWALRIANEGAYRVVNTHDAFAAAHIKDDERQIFLVTLKNNGDESVSVVKVDLNDPSWLRLVQDALRNSHVVMVINTAWFPKSWDYKVPLPTTEWWKAKGLEILDDLKATEEHWYFQTGEKA